MSEQDLLQQGRKILADCPQWEIPEDGKTLDPVLIDNGAQWCRRLARWTESVLNSEQWGSIGHVRMDQPLRFIRADSEERRAYEAVVSLLKQGHELPRRPQRRRRSSKRPVGPVHTSEYQETARRLIEGQLDNPVELCRELIPVIGRGFRRGGPAWINPVLVETLISLDQARRWLPMMRGTAVGEADWRRAYDQLRAVLETEENSQANPWTWLGVNMLGYLEPARHDVFAGLPTDIQNLMGIALFSDIGPVPESVTALRSALDLVLADLERGLANGQAEASETPAGGTSQTEGTPSATTQYVFKRTGDTGYIVAFGRRDTKIVGRKPGQLRGLDYIHVLMEYEAKHNREPNRFPAEMSASGVKHKADGTPENESTERPQLQIDDKTWKQNQRRREELPQIIAEEPDPAKKVEYQEELDGLNKILPASTRPGANGKPKAKAFSTESALKADAVRKAIDRAIKAIRPVDSDLADHLKDHTKHVGGGHKYAPDSHLDWDLG